MENDLQDSHDSMAALARAAADLADHLLALAGSLAARQETSRLRYGPGRLGGWFRRQSPVGFPLDPAKPQVLLPDGRLWSYSHSDATRFPNGRFYNPRTDYLEFAASRTFPLGTEFRFLGAVLGRYTFGFAHPDGTEPRAATGLWGLCGEGRSVRFVPAADAFAAIAGSVPAQPVG